MTQSNESEPRTIAGHSLFQRTWLEGSSGQRILIFPLGCLSITRDSARTAFAIRMGTSRIGNGHSLTAVRNF